MCTFISPSPPVTHAVNVASESEIIGAPRCHHPPGAKVLGRGGDMPQRRCDLFAFEGNFDYFYYMTY